MKRLAQGKLTSRLASVQSLPKHIALPSCSLDDGRISSAIRENKTPESKQIGIARN